MTPNKKYAVFILTHGRPDKVITYKTLKRSGYTGDVYLICDDEDKTLEKYKKTYGDKVIVFKKSDYEGRFDKMDNFAGNKVIVYARNACYDIARQLGLDYFFEYEDDYTGFYFRKFDGDNLRAIKVSDLDKLLGSVIECLDNTGALTIAFSQGGDHMGGVRTFHNIHLKRKAMNSFVFKVNKDPKDDLKFIGRMNDDVNAYLSQGKVGKLFFQTGYVSVVQLATQSNSGGNTEAYKDSGTYVKSFYSVMVAPDCCKIALMGSANRRMHHKIKWEHAVPKILPQGCKK